MMLQPTQKELELYEKLDHAETEAEKKKINEQLLEIWLEEREKLKDCPFAH